MKFSTAIATFAILAMDHAPLTNAVKLDLIEGAAGTHAAHNTVLKHTKSNDNGSDSSSAKKTKEEVLNDIVFGKMYESPLDATFSHVKGTLTPRDNRVVQATLVSAFNQIKPAGDDTEVDGVSIQSETVESDSFIANPLRAIASAAGLPFPNWAALEMYLEFRCFTVNYDDDGFDDDWCVGLGTDSGACKAGKKVKNLAVTDEDESSLNKAVPKMDDEMVAMVEEAWCMMMRVSGSPRLVEVKDCKITFK